MKVADDANLGDYRIFWEIDYKNMDGISQETSSVTRSLKIDLGKTKPEMVINKVEVTPGGSGRHQVTFTYQNMGEKEVKNLKPLLIGGNYILRIQVIKST